MLGSVNNIIRGLSEGKNLCQFCAPAPERTLAAISERTGTSLSQVADEVLYTGSKGWGGGAHKTHHQYIK